MAEPRVLVVGDHHNFQLIKAAISAASIMAVVQFVEEPRPERIEIVGLPTPMFPSDMLAQLRKLSIPCEEPIYDDTQNILEGIAQLRAWMENRIQQWLARAKSFSQHWPPIRQPCWSCLRWRSLT